MDSNANITGTVSDSGTGSPVEGVVVSTGNNLNGTTDASGIYTINNVVPGIVKLSTFKSGYGSQSKLVDIQTDQTKTADFQISTPASQLMYINPFDEESEVELDRSIKLVFNQVMDTTSFNSTSFILSDCESNVSGTFDIAQDTLVFVPDSLQQNRDYTITVTSNLKNALGIGLEQDIHSLFYTYEKLSLADIQISGELVIAPNPVNEVLRLNFNSEVSEYFLVNNRGQIVQKGKFSPNIPLEPFITSGFYILLLKDQHSRVVAKQRLIKL